ncbi:hypothetical protein [Serratia marcescens]|uniref:hypothetical protein n=1 Tax=Serratia marcescens TaxID=615 RepID=UPI001F154BE4|nr:hypothetical protein [Serratia marcescens]
MTIKFKKSVQADVSANGIIIGKNKQIVDVTLNIIEVSVNQYHAGLAFCELSFNGSEDKENRVFDFTYDPNGADVFSQAESYILYFENYNGEEKEA